MKERWWVDAATQALLGRVAPLDVSAWSQIAADGEWLSSDRQSAAARIDTAAGPLFVKWRASLPQRRRKTFGRPSRERLEARAYLRLGARGVKSATPWAVGERRQQGMLVGSVLVRPFHEGCVDAREQGKADPTVVAGLARDLRVWHDTGFRHGDCYPKNVLVPKSGAPAFPVGCPAARFGKPGVRVDRRRRTDLAQWAAGVLEVDADAQPFAFLREYCASAGIDEAALEAAVRPHFESVLRRKARRQETESQREPDGPPRPTPVPDVAGIRQTSFAISRLIDPQRT